MEHFVGIDVGAETVKIAELERAPAGLRLCSKRLVEHLKDPGAALRSLVEEGALPAGALGAVSGRSSRMVGLPRVPQKQAMATGFRFVHGARDASIVSIGSHGFSVLELRPHEVEVFRENSRCSQGTGNFLRQLVERFGLTIEEASAACEDVSDPAPLSGRCPVILKTDMTHLANKGQSHPRILAGLYDAVCENVQVLLKPAIAPRTVVLTGGVCRSVRVRRSFERFAERNGMEVLGQGEHDLFLEAIGCAVLASEGKGSELVLDELISVPRPSDLERVPALTSKLSGVRRMTRAPLPQRVDPQREVIVGLDIGSTGSKVVAIDRATGEALFEGYINTSGDPVGASRRLVTQLVEGPVAKNPIVAFGATGSGREIVGSLLSTCYGADRVFVLNEIAAHAEGALSVDPNVDTIFEIGGQDAKYIRLVGGRVVDAAMNEACSAGTGSFIEEQGKKFSGIKDVRHLADEALLADEGVSLGQHCSVFMAEIIDEAVASGASTRSVIAGIYDSIVQNYLNRVKGSRSVGDVVFCQGMPFASDALAAAVARQTGSRIIVPPNPGTVGALGIALLARRELTVSPCAPPLSPFPFLGATVSAKDVFVCKSRKGCGGAGNRCRIDRLTTAVEGRQQRFTWGGSCSLWDMGAARRKLPDLSPDPFAEREALAQKIITELSLQRGRTVIALTDEFQLKGLLPFFATFLFELGFDLVFERSRGQVTLKRGIEEANIPFCAPMQLYQGLMSGLAEREAKWIFAPMIRTLPKTGGEAHAVVCPIAQAGPDIVRSGLPESCGARVLSPVMDFTAPGRSDSDRPPGPFRIPPFGAGSERASDVYRSFESLARMLGVEGDEWVAAFAKGRDAQRRFDRECESIGRRALEFCRANGLLAVIVLGRAYTIHNSVLSSNVPVLLREQGAMGIPIDCYPLDSAAPTLGGMYWGHGQRNLRAAHQIRRREREYAVWCSNYACGPDSFNLHFFGYAMEGKPFAIIETDGHSGDAGTKTRIEAFLHCVRQHRTAPSDPRAPRALTVVDRTYSGMVTVRRRGERIIIPRMGPDAELLAACFRGAGVPAETLALPTKETLRLGRRHTSGKECVPMVITAGSVLERLERAGEAERFAFFMPTANGPCRFGVYNMLHQIILERVGRRGQVRLWSPNDADYFEGLEQGFSALLMAAFAAGDVLIEALHDTKPTETHAGAADATFRRHWSALISVLERVQKRDLSLQGALLQVASGRLFGILELLRRAAADFGAIKVMRPVPTVAVVGEIYVRLDPFANDFLVDKLEARGLKVRMAPFTEWLEYSDRISRANGEKSGFGAKLGTMIQARALSLTYSTLSSVLGWPKRTTVEDSAIAAEPWIREALVGEALLTLGAPVHEWREGLIDGVVSVGPHECMPNKIAEAQFFHVAEREGLASLTLSVNGDPIDSEVLDGFVFEVRERFERRHRAGGASASERPKPRLSYRHSE
ncbi:MAG: CoA activase [Deltaproteobacteria bacterium]|nr:CoA activase [Deltaproteobacteria bacterium]